MNAEQRGGMALNKDFRSKTGNGSVSREGRAIATPTGELHPQHLSLPPSLPPSLPSSIFIYFPLTLPLFPSHRVKSACSSSFSPFCSCSILVSMLLVLWLRLCPSFWFIFPPFSIGLIFSEVFIHILSLNWHYWKESCERTMQHSFLHSTQNERLKHCFQTWIVKFGIIISIYNNIREDMLYYKAIWLVN